MKKFLVLYYYAATGMEGQVDQRSYGFVHAINEEAAKQVVADSEYPDDAASHRFLLSCLHAQEVVEHRTVLFQRWMAIVGIGALMIIVLTSCLLYSKFSAPGRACQAQGGRYYIVNGCVKSNG
jgi:hypothetical protein